MPEHTPEAGPPDYSIVIPVYFNEENLEATMAGLEQAVLAAHQTLRGEVIFVDDGSGDRSFQVLVRLHERNPATVRVIRLTRNFGQPAALLAGLRHARGRVVATISADGQDPPGLIAEMLEAHETQGWDVVIATRAGRDESAWRIGTSRLFYRLMQKLTFPRMPTGGFDCFSLSRRALDVFLRNAEAHPFVQGQVLWMGFEPKFLTYRRRRREAGRSRWTFARKVTYLLDGVLSYSFLPLRVMSLTGLAFALLGFLYAVAIFFGKLLGGVPVEGWAPLMIVILVMGGIQMLMIGIIGEYLWRTLAQVRGRDPFVVEQLLEGGLESPATAPPSTETP